MPYRGTQNLEDREIIDLFRVQVFLHISRHMLRHGEDGHITCNGRLHHFLERVCCMTTELAGMAMMRERHLASTRSDEQERDTLNIARSCTVIMRKSFCQRLYDCRSSHGSKGLFLKVSVVKWIKRTSYLLTTETAIYFLQES